VPAQARSRALASVSVIPDEPDDLDGGSRSRRRRSPGRGAARAVRRATRRPRGWPDLLPAGRPPGPSRRRPAGRRPPSARRRGRP
jgi:hypothetical protein